MFNADYLFQMLCAYLVTISIETPVLVLLLSRRHKLKRKLEAGVWLTACTYPVVWLVLPPLGLARWQYLLIAEIFAPVAECALFAWAYDRASKEEPKATRAEFWRDMLAVTLANVASFLFGVLFQSLGWM